MNVIRLNYEHLADNHNSGLTFTYMTYITFNINQHTEKELEKMLASFDIDNSIEIDIAEPGPMQKLLFDRGICSVYSKDLPPSKDFPGRWVFKRI